MRLYEAQLSFLVGKLLEARYEMLLKAQHNYDIWNLLRCADVHFTILNIFKCIFS